MLLGTRFLMIIGLTLAQFRAAGAQEADDAARSFLPVLGVHLLNTSVVAITGGMTYRPLGPTDDFWAGLVSIDVGIASAQASVGVSRYWPPDADFGGPGTELSLRMQATILRTWGNPRYVEAGQSFVGLEVQGMFMLLGLRAGYFRRFAGASPGDNSFLSGGLVLGWQ